MNSCCRLMKWHHLSVTGKLECSTFLGNCIFSLADWLSQECALTPVTNIQSCITQRAVSQHLKNIHLLDSDLIWSLVLPCSLQTLFLFALSLCMIHIGGSTSFIMALYRLGRPVWNNTLVELKGKEVMSS